MVFTDISIFERLGRRNANIASVSALTLLLLVFLFKLPFTPEIAKEETGGGVTVALGWPDSGSFSDSPSDGGGQPVPPDETPQKPSPVSNAPSNTRDITNEDKEVDYAAEARKIEETKRRIKEIEEATKKRVEEAERATEQKRKQEEYNNKKSGFKDIFRNSGASGGTGAGSGNSGKPGNGGDPNGDPNAKNLQGAGSGNGIGTSIGGGIGDRGVLARSTPSNNYNENGDVVVNVCVMSNGQVDPASVKVNSKGTTTTSTVLRNIALTNARTYRFKAGDDNDCGSITYRFKVQ